MLHPIEKRAAMRDTCAFVTTETVDALAAKLIGMVGDRRMTMMRRYLGDHGGQPDVLAGLRIDRRGFEPVSRREGRSVGIHLTPGIYGLGFSVQRDGETEAEVYERYHYPEKHWLGRREDIVSVELRGWAGSPQRDDKIRIERWNQHGVGEEIIVVFDDVDLLEELAWDVKGDQVREVRMWDEFCDFHGFHYEHPSHERNGSCVGRAPTRAETLGVLLALLAALAETKADTEAGEVD